MIAVPTRTIRWQLPAVVLIALAIVAIWSLLRHGDAVQVLTAPVAFQDLSEPVTTNGTVMPTSEFQTRAFWPGIIDKVYVELDDKVSPGQLLVSMKDPFAISRMTAANAALQGWRLSVENIRNGGSQEDRIDLRGNLANAQLEQVQATKALAALQQLQQKGAASAAEVDSAEQRLKAANATLEQMNEKTKEPYSTADLKTNPRLSHDARVRRRRIDECDQPRDAAGSLGDHIARFHPGLLDFESGGPNHLDLHSASGPRLPGGAVYPAGGFRARSAACGWHLVRAGIVGHLSPCSRCHVASAAATVGVGSGAPSAIKVAHVGGSGFLCGNIYISRSLCGETLGGG
ncbi:MAG: efflux RND transporter periplasmic adaptor subunit [Acidobacteriaceae bacterium]